MPLSPKAQRGSIKQGDRRQGNGMLGSGMFEANIYNAATDPVPRKGDMKHESDFGVNEDQRNNPSRYDKYGPNKSDPGNGALPRKFNNKPDHGETYMPAASNVPDHAPQPLDHFKRGYRERAELRDRELVHLNSDFDRREHHSSSSTDSAKGGNSNGSGDSRKQGTERGPRVPPSYYGPAGSVTETREEDKRFFFRCKSNNPGFSMEDVVERLCYPRTNVAEEMDRARHASPESFQSGRAITAILSQLGRRRQMGVAMQVWNWMEHTQGITRNVFHYNALINVCEKIKDWKRALELLRQMDEDRVPKNEITYSSAISACEKGGNWRTALDLLKKMKSAGIMPTAIAYNAAISACEKGLNPSKALEIFDEMKKEGVRPTVVTFSALISACEKGQQWKLALSVLEEMKTTFGPNVIAYSAAISALSKGQQWEKAWELFCEIERSGEKLSVVTYNATMTALEKGLQWQRALDLFDEMKYKNMPVTVVSYGSAISACEKGYQWRQCLEYLDEMTERKIAKNVIIFGAAMSCMEKSCRADIAFQLMERMKLEGVRPNVHIYNSAISACARCKLWKKGFELFKEMDEVGIKRDVVTYNAVLDAVCSQVDLAKQIFHEGVERGFYAKVSRLGTQWLELDLHFLSLGGGETALRWWFEECLVPYLGDSKELASVKSIDIVTGYGKTRARGARKGDDGMRKRVRAMLSFMNVCEIEQPNLGRIHIDKSALMKEVERNGGRIVFDARGYEQYKIDEGLDEPYSDAPQFVRPRGGALHGRDFCPSRDSQQGDPIGDVSNSAPSRGSHVNNGNANERLGSGENRYRPDEENYYNNRAPQSKRSDNYYGKETSFNSEAGRTDNSRFDGLSSCSTRGVGQNSKNYQYENYCRSNNRGSGGGERDDYRHDRPNTSSDYSSGPTPQSYQSRQENRSSHDQSYPVQSFNGGKNHQEEWKERDTIRRFELDQHRSSDPSTRHVSAPQCNPDADFQINRDNPSWRDVTDSSNYKSHSERKSSYRRNGRDPGYEDVRHSYPSQNHGYNERKRSHDSYYDERSHASRGRQQGGFGSSREEGNGERNHYANFNRDDGYYGGKRDYYGDTSHYGSNNSYMSRRDYSDNSYPYKRHHR